MSHYVTMEHVTSAGNLVTWFMSWSRQPPFAVRKQRFWHRAQLTASRHSITKTNGLSNTLRVQKGQRRRMDTVTHIWSRVELISKTFNIRWCWSIWKYPIIAHPTLSSNESGSSTVDIFTHKANQHGARFMLMHITFTPFTVTPSSILHSTVQGINKETPFPAAASTTKL